MEKTDIYVDYLCLKSQNIISLTNRTTRYANDRMPIKLSIVAHVQLKESKQMVKNGKNLKTAIQ